MKSYDSAIGGTGSLFPELSFPPITLKSNTRQLSKERLPTNTSTYLHPVHRWYNFIAGFSPEFVQRCCAQMHCSEHVLLDPFAGCATAPVVACQLGFRAVGFEANPVFAKIGNAKLAMPLSCVDLDDIETIVQAGLRQPVSVGILAEAPRVFLSKLFATEILEMLLGAREALITSGYQNDDTAFLLLTRVADLSSHSKTDGIYKAPTSTKVARSPIEACREIAAIMRSDIRGMSAQSCRNPGKIYNCSSERMPQVADDTVSLVVTSPPYLNNFDYAEMTRMHLYFWGMADSWGDITHKVRSKLIVNTTTALKGHKHRQAEYRNTLEVSLAGHLDDLVSSLAERRTSRAGKKEYDYLLFPYFSQMTSVLKECIRCMKPGAEIHIVVGDAALYGVHISTPQFLQCILDSIGFRDTRSTFLRQRGHRWILDKRDGSETGLGEYHVQAFK